MKQLLWDPWEAAHRSHPNIEVVNFRSIDNPAFPREEYERARQTMPLWRFLMLYEGLFTRPAGLIYSCFDRTRHVCPRFDIPPEWERVVGLDFGGVNTAAVFFAKERVERKETGRLVAYREYKAGDRSAAEHCYHIMRGDPAKGIPPEPRIPICAGGSKSEGQWRTEFKGGGTVNGKRIAGLPIHAPPVRIGDRNSIVESGILRVWQAFATNQIVIFDDLHGLLDELGTYSRELDDTGEPTEKIQEKESFHRLDAVRYVISWLNPDKQTPVMKSSPVAHPGRFPPERTLPPIIREHRPNSVGWVAFPGLKNF
jgi:hypothetical protein